ncbi:MAG TPA: iron ABC transporter permease, partial [Psychromonas hadalis]|nr:iron ABC transporter permease [Psychromonas hadalis]
MFNNPHSRFLFFAMLITLFVALMIAAILQGPADISLENISQILQHTLFNSPLNHNIADWQSSIILDVRLPRMIVALFAGASLALCGLVMQGMFRNPLASPSVLGVSSGASLGAVIAIYLGASLISAWAIPLFAFIGAGISLSVVYRVALLRGQT